VLGIWGLLEGITLLVLAFRGGGWGPGVMGALMLILGMILLGTATAPAQAPEWADELFAKDGNTHHFGNVPRGPVLSRHLTNPNIHSVTIIFPHVS